MRRFVRVGKLSVCGLVFASCAHVPRTSEEGTIEIHQISDSVACELAAVANDSRFKAQALQKWPSKSSLDLTIVDTIGADGKLIWSIAYGGGPVKLTPNLGASHRDTSVAHLDFGTSIEAAVTKYGKTCIPGPDPSETSLGLAAWLTSTLAASNPDITQHAGMTYTREFQVTLAAGTRFGYKTGLVDLDSGPGLSRVGTNRLTVALAPPSQPKPTRVIIVGQEEKLMGVLPPARRRGSRVPTDDSTLNRLLLQRSPVRIEGQ